MRYLMNNKGVTMMMLVITVIVLIILTSFAIFYSNDIGPEAKLATAYNSMSEIKRAFQEAESTIELKPDEYDEYDFFGKTIYEDGSNVSDLEARCGLDPSEHFSAKTYKITPENDDEVKRRVNALEISTVNAYYIADIGNNKYYIVDGVKRKTQDTVYEYSDILKLYDILTNSYQG